MDAEWRYTFLNAAARQMLLAHGLNPDAVIGRTVWEVFPDLLGTEIERVQRRVMAERQAVSVENFYEPWRRWYDVRLFPANDGGLFDFLSGWSFPIKVATGKLIGTFAVYSRQPREVSPREFDLAALLTQTAAMVISRHTDEEVRRKAEESLRESEERYRDAHAQLADRAVQLEKLVQQRTAKLQEMVDELQHVSYAMAHDMRAPLRAMNTFATLLSEEAASIAPSERQDYTRRIVVAATRLDRLIQDALNYTKVAQAREDHQHVSTAQRKHEIRKLRRSRTSRRPPPGLDQ